MTAVGSRTMVSKVDYYTPLSRAVAGLDRDSYASRGAVYEREHKALLRRLFSANPPRSDAEIDQEQQAFRDAIRRIEFGEDELRSSPHATMTHSATSLAPAATDLDEAAKAAGPARALPPSPSPPPSEGETLLESGLRLRPEPLGPIEREEPREHEPHQDEDGHDPDLAGGEGTVVVPAVRRPIFGRLVRRAVLALALIGLGTAGYAYVTGEFELRWLTELAGDSRILGIFEGDAQQVLLFDGDSRDPTVTKTAGKAVWRLRSEPGDSRSDPATLVQIKVDVPERRIAATISIRREPPDSAMTHLFEFRFTREDEQPDGDIANVTGVFMATADRDRRAVLIGRGVRVTPGVYLFGLAGQEAELEQNIRSFKELPWLDIPLTYRNGAVGIMAIEKGAAGERVINEAFKKWGQ
jgi:hypothetical protein